MSNAIVVKNLSKIFKLPMAPKASVREHIIDLFKPKAYKEFKALNKVNFEIKRGDFVGIVGQNGSGKSTLLKLLSGIYEPSEGDIQIEGKLVPLLELGIGFNMELSARDNVFLNGTILGLTIKDIKEKYEEIVDYAGLEGFMYQELKHFSSGMKVRLAFSIAIQAKADILLLDEVLAVGDLDFQEKCYKTFSQLQAKGVTIILVAHELELIKNLCKKTLLLQHGKVINYGPTDKVIAEYEDNYRN